MERFYTQNCHSFLKLALYWVRVRDWDRAIDALKAVIRNANRAKLLRTAGMALVAIRRCQDAQRFYGQMVGGMTPDEITAAMIGARAS